MDLIYKNFLQPTPQHYQLLLDADPSKKLIDAYLPQSICIEAYTQREMAGVVILLPTRPETIEIVNIAVVPEQRNKGIGQALIEHSIQCAKERHYQIIEIGTGSTSFGQLYLYQKCGFRMVSIDTDFFVKHYSEPIIENKLILKDMVRLRLNL
ncbi:MAG: GNAT family N-acetyltransferase [Sporolactobacillus sp.]|uniref:GNAT family N-acetyltransferase n=1 Tax=Sporolactobacillus sp. STSJ-5 TaxID=2965076 RepID=UPI0021045399|nr:GNAT family N-acetyltransferase [Sporolactobacillus sp. STSJ-5]MCQ2011451.1 GNAT family N-acetyltransferase [Sporolactobacillus sp. STSJ-5]